MKIKLSQKQWQDIGKKAGWIKTARTLVDNDVENWLASENATLYQKIDEPRQYKEIWKNDENTHTLEVTYEKFWELKSERGAGYGFPCNEKGRLTVVPSEDAKTAIKSGNYKDPVIVKQGHLIRSGCPCGSGLHPYQENDARGIPLGLMCDKCRKDNLSKYRPEVLTDSQYEADEPIEPEDY